LRFQSHIDHLHIHENSRYRNAHPVIYVPKYPNQLPANQKIRVSYTANIDMSKNSIKIKNNAVSACNMRIKQMIRKAKIPTEKGFEVTPRK